MSKKGIMEAMNPLHEPLISDDGASCTVPDVTFPELNAGNNTNTNNNNNNPEDNDVSSPGQQQPRQQQRRSRNIPLMLWYMVLRCLGEGLWLGSVLAAYVYMMQPHRPALIGYLSALEGMVQFGAAGVAGFLGDGGRCRRDSLLKVSSATGFVASCCIALSSWNHENTKWMIALVIGLAMNGAFDGIGLTASLAIFADSIPDGQRSYYFTLRTLCTTAGYTLGPLVALALFVRMGSEWTISACAWVIQGAQLLLLPAFVLLCFFRDENVNETEEEGGGGGGDPLRTRENGNIIHDNTTTEGQIATAKKNDCLESKPDVGDNVEQEERVSLVTADDDINNQNDTNPEQQERVLSEPEDATSTSRRRRIAISAAISDVVCAMAGGMSLRYFTLFFLDHLYLGPVMVSVLDAISCLWGAALLVCAQRLSKVWKGRCSVTVLFKGCGSAFLIAMVVVYYILERGDDEERQQKQQQFLLLRWYREQDDDDTDSSSVVPSTSNTTKWIVCTLYLLQNAFLSSTSALTRSLLMDNVPSHERAKWSALESINIFGWCGSAAVGGWLVELFRGVLPVFLISASLQLVGILPLVHLIWQGLETLEDVEDEET